MRKSKTEEGKKSGKSTHKYRALREGKILILFNKRDDFKGKQSNTKENGERISLNI